MLVLSLTAWADPSTPREIKPATAPEASPEFLIGTAERLNQGNNSDELKTLAARLTSLKQKRALLVQQRAGKQAELTSIQASGNTALAAQFKTQFDAIKAQIDAVDAQIQATNDKIQALQTRQTAGATASVGPATGVKPQPVSIPKAAKAASTVPSAKVKAAASALAQSTAPSVGAARGAALQLLTTYQPGYTPTDIEQLAFIVMEQATKDADKDLREQMAAAMKLNSDKEKQREAVQMQKEAHDRSTRLHHVLSEMKPNP